MKKHTSNVPASLRRLKPKSGLSDGYVTMYSPDMGRDFKVTSKASQVRRHGLPKDPNGKTMTLRLPRNGGHTNVS